jgi:hypothetical protein
MGDLDMLPDLVRPMRCYLEKQIVFRRSITESSCFSLWLMSDEDEFEVPSPDVGASSSRDVVPPMTPHDHSDDNDENQSEYSSNEDSQQK